MVGETPVKTVIQAGCGNSDPTGYALCWSKTPLPFPTIIGTMNQDDGSIARPPSGRAPASSIPTRHRKDPPGGGPACHGLRGLDAHQLLGDLLLRPAGPAS